MSRRTARWLRTGLAVLLWVGAGQAQRITTVAGRGLGDHGPAVNAPLYAPTGIALDAAGNLYIAELRNSRIRRVDAVSGTISTVAGDGTTRFAGDGGPATAASLDFHWGAGVACDAEGNLYIAEPANNRVRRVDAATGVITTVAGDGTWQYPQDGTLATGASVGGPRAVALGAQGNLYISSDHRIRRVDGATGVITTVAGGGCGYADADWEYCHGDGIAAVSAELTTPDGVTVDRQGNLYFCEFDANANRVRRVDARTGVITTVAGSFGEGFAGDGGPAVGALLYSPLAVAFDTRGDLYIADATNGRVRRVEGKTASAVTADAPDGPPRALALHQNVPNPFNAQTAIVYELSEASSVTLAVYSLLGQPVRTLAAAKQPARLHRMVWDGRDSQGLPLASGVYVCQLTARGQRAVRRMLLLR